MEVDSDAQGGDAGVCQLGQQGIRKANHVDAEISQDEAGTAAKRKTVVRGQLRGVVVFHIPSSTVLSALRISPSLAEALPTESSNSQTHLWGLLVLVSLRPGPPTCWIQVDSSLL